MFALFSELRVRHILDIRFKSTLTIMIIAFELRKSLLAVMNLTKKPSLFLLMVVTDNFLLAQCKGCYWILFRRACEYSISSPSLLQLSLKSCAQFGEFGAQCFHNFLVREGFVVFLDAREVLFDEQGEPAWSASLRRTILLQLRNEF